MCEFCSRGPNDGGRPDNDSSNPSFAGFFSVDAINAAVAQSQAQRSRRTSGSSDGVDGEVIDDEDDDGT